MSPDVFTLGNGLFIRRNPDDSKAFVARFRKKFIIVQETLNVKKDPNSAQEALAELLNEKAAAVLISAVLERRKASVTVTEVDKRPSVKSIDIGDRRNH